MNIKNLGERFSYGYESDNLSSSQNNRSKSFTKENFTSKNYEDHLEDKLKRNKNNRYLVPKSKANFEETETKRSNFYKLN